ncbi:ATP-binding cassette domain-containing protein [Prochlorothrix hollandica]|uniref:ATP-binding cassette domain-containing protein n=1 Tax=Prochlorothrix hollandica TaxID=1223 RepID=UPI0033416578
MDMPLLQVQNLGFTPSLGQPFLLQTLSFTLSPGQTQLLAGAPGSGKTLALRLLNGLEAASEGMIWLNQKPRDQWEMTDWRRSIVAVSSQPHLLGLSVQDNLTYPLHLQNLGSPVVADRLAEIIDLLELPQELLRSTAPLLSQPQQQQVAIGRALMLHPPFLVLDEPSHPWPEPVAARLWQRLQGWVQQQRLGLVVTSRHLPPYVQGLDRVVLLDRGRCCPAAALTEGSRDQIQHWLHTQSQREAADWGDA